MSIIERAAGRLPRTEDKASASAPAVARTAGDEQPAVHVVPRPGPEDSSGTSRKSSRHSVKKIKLDLAKLRDNGMVTPDADRSAIAEEFRAIKRTLLLRAFDAVGDSSPPNNLIMVTSSMPEEGKSFCSMNLAMSIAMERDRTVLLVDADVARPSILRNLGLTPEPGLMDLLLEEKLELPDVLLKTNIDTLSILPAGTSHRHATELLASQAMSRLLHELANRYPDRIVIFDSPPLLLTSEARVLAQQMGQIVVVVEAEKTTQTAVKSSLRHLEGCPNVSLIYNKAKPFSVDGMYGYGYGY